MNDLAAWAALAAWFGILTSISPCPLATNITAISYIGRKVKDPRLVLLSGALYTAGRALTYTVLGVLLVSGILSAPKISFWLQNYMTRFMGPVLILVGMFLLGMIGTGTAGGNVSEKTLGRADRMGIYGAFLIGILFALSFCPTSAALFFGSLLPLAVSSGSGLLLPALYGIGTALPVVVFAIMIVMGANYVGKLFHRMTQFEKWMRVFTGILFIGTGIWFSFRYIFHLF